jgi:hypothetical protein
MLSIEDVILAPDRRGISSLRSYLPINFCEQAAKLALSHIGTAFIVTGFYTVGVGKPETDGPPGALVVRNALAKLGYNVYFVTDQFTAPLMSALLGREERVITFPLADHANSRDYALRLLSQFQPSLLISIERCGLTKNGTYLNMSGADISAYNAKIDYLFCHHQKTIGIGDGGNEIGMGNLAEVIPTVPGLPENPCVIRVDRLVIAGVANWGSYGMITALSQLTQRNLLPVVEEERALIERAVALGAVDGIKGEAVLGVDGFSLEENSQVLAQLHTFLRKKQIPLP